MSDVEDSYKELLNTVVADAAAEVNSLTEKLEQQETTFKTEKQSLETKMNDIKTTFANQEQTADESDVIAEHLSIEEQLKANVHKVKNKQ